MAAAIEGLARLRQPMPDGPTSATETLQTQDKVGSPTTIEHSLEAMKKAARQAAVAQPQLSTQA